MIDKNVLIPLFLAFAISVALSPFVIPFLQRLKVGQTERDRGRKIASEKNRDADNGRIDHSDQPDGDVAVFSLEAIRRLFRCCF